jgi:hypothetical protein
VVVVEAVAAKNRGIQRRERQRELSDPPVGTDSVRRMPRSAARAARGVRIGREAERERHRGAPADKWSFPAEATRATEVASAWKFCGTSRRGSS